MLPLVVDGLTFRSRGQRLLDAVGFTLSQPSLTILLGPNGAGKTLLLRLCTGLIEPSGGHILWAGHEPRESRRRIGMVFQHPVLLRRSVLSNVTYALGTAGVALRRRRTEAFRALEETGLDHLAKRPARVLSGGERQRLAIARAWAQKPSVLLLDEPTASLDPQATLAIERLVSRIGAAGTKVVMATHDLNQARRLAGDVLFLHQGRLLQHAGVSTFFKRPACAEIQAFIKGDLLV
jgi:tungstate transport system ATP-binding protein